MSENENTRPRTKTDLRRGADRTSPQPSRAVNADEEAFLLAGDHILPATPTDPEPPRKAPNNVA
jgi:hypothetical protein